MVISIRTFRAQELVMYVTEASVQFELSNFNTKQLMLVLNLAATEIAFEQEEDLPEPNGIELVLTVNGQNARWVIVDFNVRHLSVVNVLLGLNVWEGDDLIRTEFVCIRRMDEALGDYVPQRIATVDRHSEILLQAEAEAEIEEAYRLLD